MSGARRKLTALAIVGALVGGGAAQAGGVAANAKAKAKPHAGQFCSPSKTPPAGFKCVKKGKGKGAKYRLVKK